jgi:iron complex outermembrane receptor protein
VTAGLRYEQLDVEVADFVNTNSIAVEGGEITFSEPLFNLSAAYDLNETVTVFGGYAEAFELGSLARALADGTITSVDDDIEGKKTRSFELGMRGTAGAFDYSATAFYSKSDNGETYDQNLDLILAPEEIYGLELTADYYASEALTLGGTATLLEGRYDTDGDGDVDMDLGTDRIAPPKLTLYAEYGSPVGTYRLDMTHVGGRNPDSDQFLGLQTTDPYTVFDASARFEVAGGDLGIGVHNLFDTEYAPALQQSYSVEAFGYDDYYYVQGPGRAISISYMREF